MRNSELERDGLAVKLSERNERRLVRRARCLNSSRFHFSSATLWKQNAREEPVRA